MICFFRWPLTIFALIAVTPAAIAELRIDDDALRNLGVEFVSPAPAGTGGGLQARAHVIVPPEAEYVISSTEAGLVRRLLVTVGQPVAAGQVVAELNSPAFLTLQQEFLAAAQSASVAAAQLDRDLALYEEGIIARRRLEQARADAVAARARRDEHRQMLRIAGLPEDSIDRLADGAELQPTLALRSPIDGTVLDAPVRVGESVGPAEPVCRVADLNALWLDIHLPQEFVTQVSPGMRIETGHAENPIAGRVIAVGGAVDRATQTISVRAALDPGESGLRPGQLVELRILGSGTNARDTANYALPAAALVRSRGTAYLFLRTASGVEAREVAVAGRSDGDVLVSNIAPTDRVAVSGVTALKALWLSGDETGSP